MIKKIDKLGRVVIPKGYRQELGLKPGDPLDFAIEDGKLLISAHSDGCTFCGSMNTASTFQGKKICGDCISRIQAMPGT